MRSKSPVRLRLLELDARVLPSFTPLGTFATGLVVPVEAVGADFNGDGLDDLAVYNARSGPTAPFVAVLLSTGDGQFVQSATLPADINSFPTSLITADFNGDGNADLATGSGSSATITVYLGDGNGAFAESFTAAGGTFGLGAGDFNGDGRTDLVALQGGGNQYRIFTGDGLGQFAASALLPAAFNNSRIETGDFDNNGTVDFVSVDFAGAIAAYLGNGDGTFAAAVLTATSGTIGEFVIGQFDADNRLDVVTLEGSNIVLHSNLGGGQFVASGIPFFTFSSSGVSLSSIDFDSDGRPDIVATEVFNSAAVLTSNGDGTFTPDIRNPYPFTFFGRALPTGDFDGDSNPDFAVLGDGIGQVFLNDHPDTTSTGLFAVGQRFRSGTPIQFGSFVVPVFPGHDTPQGTVTFTAGSATLGTVTLVNGIANFRTVLPPGVYDVIATYSGSPAVIGPGGFVEPRQSELLPSQSAPVRIVVYQPDVPEFAVGSDNGSVICYHNEEVHQLSGFDRFGGPYTGVRPSVGDFNGDGVQDIAVGSSPGIVAQVSVVNRNDGQVLVSAQPFDGFQGGVFIAAADFNGDGIADLAVGTDAGDRPHVKLFLTLNGALVEVASFFAFEEGFRGGVRLAAGDINGDGTPDLVVGAGAGAGPSVAVFDGVALSQGTARRLINDFYAYAAEYNGGVFVAAGDVDGDGFADIITGAGIGAPHITVVSGRSLIQENPTQLASYYAGPQTNLGGIRVAARDLDGDGFSDVIAGAGIGNGSTVWIHSGFFLSQLGTATPTSAEDVFPGLFAGIYVG